MGKLIPVLLILVGFGAGAGAGFALRPHPPEPAPEEACADAEHCEPESGFANHEVEANTESEFVALAKQFVVPVIDQSQVSSLVVLSISLEVEIGAEDFVYAREPKIRDVFLQALFLHAHSGGFSGQFTSGQAMADLRGSLNEAAYAILGKQLHGVLITEIVRQDM